MNDSIDMSSNMGTGWSVPRNVRRISVVALLSLVLLQAVTSMREKSATIDEVLHLPAGYSYLTTKDFRLNPEHPPLIKILAALPLLALKVNFATNHPAWQNSEENSFGYDFLYNRNDADTLLFWGRLPVVVLSLFLGLFVYRWASMLYGDAAGLFALFLYSLNPDIVAHSQLVTTDLGAACFIFTTLWCADRFLKHPNRARLFCTGVSLGLALVAKFTCLLLVPILFILGAVRFSDKQFRKSWREGFTGYGLSSVKALLVSLLLIGAISYAVLWGAYLFRFSAMVTEGGKFRRDWNELIPQNPFLRSTVLFVKEHKLLPEAYLYGLLYSGTAAVAGRQYFLWGRYSSTGWWYYFIVTFALKTPVPLLLLIGFAVFHLRRRFLERSSAELFLIVPMVVYFVCVSAIKLNIGHRHLLPIYPLLFVMASHVVTFVSKVRRFFLTALIALLAWYVAGALRIYPHYLAYFNELVGGPENGYKYLVDSNIDWGQDLKGLKKYLDAKGITKLKLSYFGLASAQYYRIPHEPAPGLPLFCFGKGMEQNLEDGDNVAVSVTNLQAVWIRPFPEFQNLARVMDELKTRYRPVAKIGYSIFVYKIDPTYLVKQ